MMKEWIQRWMVGVDMDRSAAAFVERKEWGGSSSK